MARLSVNGITKYRKPQAKKTQMPILPGDMAILRQLDREKAERVAAHAVNEPLEYVSPLRHFNPLSNPEEIKLVTDVTVIIDAILRHAWTEYPQNESGQYQLSNKLLASAQTFREEAPQAVTMNQLYGMFPTSTTKVDKMVNSAVAGGKVRVIAVNATDSSDLVLTTDHFEALMRPRAPELYELCREQPSARWFTAEQLAAAHVDVGAAVQLGFLAQHPASFDAKQLALPGQGPLLKFMREARQFLLRAIVQNNKKFKEIPESLLLERFTSSKKCWTQFYGVRLETILYDCIGGGYIDGFNTPVGRGWKVLKN